MRSSRASGSEPAVAASIVACIKTTAVSHFTLITLFPGSTDELSNLCLACTHYNLQKGPNLAGLANGRIYVLFNPRTQNWHRHFEWDQTKLIGKTTTGAVTIQVLDINGEAQVMRREALLFEGRFPPDE